MGCCVYRKKRKALKCGELCLQHCCFGGGRAFCQVASSLCVCEQWPAEFFSRLRVCGRRGGAARSFPFGGGCLGASVVVLALALGSVVNYHGGPFAGWRACAIS